MDTLGLKSINQLPNNEESFDLYSELENMEFMAEDETQLFNDDSLDVSKERYEELSEWLTDGMEGEESVARLDTGLRLQPYKIN